MPLICRRSVPQQVTVKPGVFLAEMVRIPPASEMEVMATAGADSEQDWILEGEPREKLPVMMAHAVVRPVEIVDSTVATVQDQPAENLTDVVAKLWSMVEGNDSLDNTRKEYLYELLLS